MYGKLVKGTLLDFLSMEGFIIEGGEFPV